VSDWVERLATLAAEGAERGFDDDDLAVLAPIFDLLEEAGAQHRDTVARGIEAALGQAAAQALLAEAAELGEVAQRFKRLRCLVVAADLSAQPR